VRELTLLPPLTTHSGQLRAELAPFRVILHPCAEGRNGFEVDLSDGQRVEFGAALRRFHATAFPPAITRDVPRETFSPRWRERVKYFLDHVADEAFDDPVSAELAAFLNAHRLETLDLVDRSERLALSFQAHSPPFLLCHADIHAWNLLIDARGALYLVDWDTLIFAPRERDLMFVGAGLGGNGHSPQEEIALFYQGYGPVQVDPAGIAYYRHERIVEDIAVLCEQILLTRAGGQDREQSLEYLKSNYLPGGTMEMAGRPAG
jgi:spectinomycin phosphotransferase